MAATTTLPTPAPAGAPPGAPASPHGKGKGDAAALLVPFTRASHEHVEPFMDVTQQLGAAAVNLPVADVPAYGYLRAIFLRVDGTGGTGGSAVGNEDAPWSVIGDISLSDVNGASIVGPFTGHDLFLANKYGGYNFWPDPTLSPIFSAVSSNGNFAFALRVPVEISARDALGAIPNENAASAYKLRVTIAASTGLFTTPPVTTLPAVRVRAWMEAWTQPNPSDLRGNPQEQQPREMGTLAFWTKNVKNVSAGAQTIKLDRVGNLMRNLVLIFRNATPVRDSTDFPDPLQLVWDGRTILNIGRDVLRHYAWERYGFLAAALETGVFVLDFTHDFDGHPGGELRDLWLATTQASRLELVGNFGVAGTLSILTNDVQPVGNIYQPVAG